MLPCPANGGCFILSGKATLTDFRKALVPAGVFERVLCNENDESLFDFCVSEFSLEEWDVRHIIPVLDNLVKLK